MERWEACLTKVRAALAASGYDAALTFRLEHVRYVSPYRPPSGLFMASRSAALVMPNALTVFVPQVDAAPLAEEAAGRFAVEVLPINPAGWGAVLNPALPRPPARIALDGALASVTAGIRGSFRHDGGPFEEARLVKTPEEVELIRGGLEMVAAAIGAAWEALAPGVSELELAAIAEHAARAAGAEGFAFFAIVTSNGEIARRRYATDYRFQDGDLVFLDLGVVNGGYCAEFSRATVVGERVTPEQRGIFQAAYGANLALRELVRPGVMGSELDAAARAAIQATPYAAYEYRHVTSTGIGVMLQERPIISNAADAGQNERLQAGMVLNLEPGVYHPELGGLRAEDIVLVTDDGYELLTPFPYDERLMTGP